MEDKRLSLKTHRLIAGYSIKAVSELTGISEKSLRDWENDTEKLNNARFSSIITLCKVYGISIDQLEY